MMHELVRSLARFAHQVLSALAHMAAKGGVIAMSRQLAAMPRFRRVVVGDRRGLRIDGRYYGVEIGGARLVTME
jgi:KaiC/GvpD/RAD55 family RecA-like ATPase